MKRSLLILAFLWPFLATIANDPVKQALGRAGDASAFPGENLVVVFDSTQVDMQESGLTYVTIHNLTKVLTRKGATEINVVKYGYDPLSAWIEIKKAMIHKADGSVVPIDLGNVKDYPAPARAIYWGAREKMLPVGRLDPGDALEVVLYRKGFTYALLQDDDDRYIPPMRGHFYDIVDFFAPTPVLEKVYRVNIPKSKTLQYEFYNGEVTASAWIEGEKTVYSFTKKNIMPLKSEARMVALSDVAPKLLLSTSPDWKAKSVWFYNVNEEFGSFESTPEIKAKVDEILKGAKNEMDSVSRLTHWCGDEIRYSGISMGEGEGFTLHKGEMNFTDRCGVCKDKAGMLITMLRAAGFESYPAMTMAGSRIDYIPADQFNHCVTIVKLSDGKYHLLDPTWVPFIRELWSSAEQQQEYLMGVPEGADLATTPVSDPSNHYVKIIGTSELSITGTLSGTVEITAEGQSDAALRGIFRNFKPELWRANIEKELQRIHPKAQLAKLDYADPFAYMAGPMRITVTYRIPEYAVVSGKTIVFTPIVAAQIFKAAQPHLFVDTGLKERKYAFRDRCSRLVELQETTKIPEIKEVIRIPQSVTQPQGIASFNGGYERKGNILTYSGKAVYSKRIYEAADWQAYKDAVDGQNRFLEQPVMITIQ